MDMRRTVSNFYPKSCYYFADGTGRDGYITINNGGLGHYKPKGYTMGSRIILLYLGCYPNPIQQPSHSSSIDAKYFFYRSDGTGRDTYVTYS